MLTVRKVDWNTEIFIFILMIFTIPALSIYGFLIGLFILGIIQLLSAALNTRTFLHNGIKRKIKNYWLFVVLDLMTLLIGSVYTKNEFLMGLLEIVAMTGATAIAIYYLVIYKKLIDTLELRNELAGFTKS